MIRRFGLILILFCTAACMRVLAADCSLLPYYWMGNDYKSGEQVQHNNHAYICNVGGWCTLGGAYEPGVGWAWKDAWSDQGACNYGADYTDLHQQGMSDFSNLLSEQQFDVMFPGRDPFYTYQSFIQATEKFPAFANTGDIEMRRREVAAALSNFFYLTKGLTYVNAIDSGVYCSGVSTPCGVCATGKQYHGRGPMQLSWNGQYCAASQALGYGVLLWSQPELLASDPVKAWEVALWYWMTQTGRNDMSAHDCIISDQGFACVVRSISGVFQCGGRFSDVVYQRVDVYRRFLSLIGSTAVGPDGC